MSPIMKTFGSSLQTKSKDTTELGKHANCDRYVFKDIDGKRQYFQPGELVQPCTSIEILLTVAGSYKNQNTVQAIWLESDNPIEKKSVEQALNILSKQLPILQFCLAKRGMQIWFKRIKDFKIDFDISPKQVIDLFHDMLETNYDLWNGPLWKVRLVTATPKNNRKYCVALVFSVQHTITDGSTNMRICRETAAILNQILKGVSVQPIPVPIPKNIDHFLDLNPSIGYLAKKVVKKFNSTILKGFSRKSSFDATLTVPITKTPATKILFDDFTEAETKNLIKMCKGANITVHSFIVTLTNFALMTCAQSKSPDCPIGPKMISVTHCVNLRRYFDAQHSDALGCHVSWLENKNRMSLNEAKEFWNTAKRIHKSIKDEVEVKKTHLKTLPILHYAGLIFPTNRFLTRNGYKNTTDCHYVTTNMGNLKDLLPEPKEDDEVEISYMLRGVSSHLANNPFLLTFHTFRNKFMISIDYYTCKMSDQNAKEFFAILCQFIRRMTAHTEVNLPSS